MPREERRTAAAQTERFPTEWTMCDGEGEHYEPQIPEPESAARKGPAQVLSIRVEEAEERVRAATGSA